MADSEMVSRPEFATFQAEIRGDMRDLRDGMVRGEARQDAIERRTADIERQIASGFEDQKRDNERLRTEMKSLSSVRTWILAGVATGGSAAGAAIWHAISAGIHP